MKILFRKPWPRLPDGIYAGEIVAWERGLAPWGKRKKRDGTRVSDCHAYVHISADRGATPKLQAAIDSYVDQHARAPVVFYACRYEVDGDGNILPIGRSSKLYELLQIFGGLTGEDEIRLDSVLDRALGWRVTVQVHTPANSHYRDRKTRRAIPKPEQARFSRVQHLLDASSIEQSALSSKQEALSNKQPATPEREGEVLRGDEIAAGAGVARRAPGTQPTAPPGEYRRPPPVGADAQDGIDSTTFSRRLREHFGRTEYQRRSPCPYCGGPTFARDWEEPWCPRCEG